MWCRYKFPGAVMDVIVHLLARRTSDSERGSVLRGSPSRRWAGAVITTGRAVQAPPGWVVLATECVACRLAKIGSEDALRC